MKNILFLSIFFCLLTNVHADEFLYGLLDEKQGSKDHTGWYLGGKLGQASTELEWVDKPYTTENTSTVGGVYFGYNVNAWFGLEAEISYTDNAGDSLFNRGIVESAGISALRIQPKFTYQMNDSLAFIFKGGLYSVSYSMYPTDAARMTFKLDTIEYWSGMGLTAGIGLQISVTKRVNIRAVFDSSLAELEYEGEAGLSNINATINEYSIGLHYQF